MTRRVMILTEVQARPLGITTTELAERVSLNQNYLYRVLAHELGAGRVAKRGQRWFWCE